MEYIIDLLTDSNGHHAVGESDIKDAIVEIRKMAVENAALRAENERLKSMISDLAMQP